MTVSALTSAKTKACNEGLLSAPLFVPTALILLTPRHHPTLRRRAKFALNTTAKTHPPYPSQPLNPTAHLFSPSPLSLQNFPPRSSTTPFHSLLITTPWSVLFPGVSRIPSTPLTATSHVSASSSLRNGVPSCVASVASAGMSHGAASAFKPVRRAP